MVAENEGRPARTNGGGVTGILVGFLVIVLLVLAALLAWVFLADDEDEGLDVGVSTSDIASDPEEYYGVEVTVSGEVNEVVGPRAFTIGGEGFFGGEEVLIVSAADVPIPAELERGEDEGVLEDDIIQVSGVVSEFIVVDVEEELGIDLDDEAFADFEGEPAIVADQVVLSPRLGGVPAGALSIETITDNEDLFNGEEVSLNGEVSELVGPAAFMIADVSEEEGIIAPIDERMLVIAAPDLMDETIAEDVPVEVSGTVRVFEEDEDAEALVEEEFGFDVEDGILDFWDDEPILVADTITAGTADATVDIEQIATDALAYVGQEVTTGGVVEEVLDETRAFVLTSEDEDAIVDVEILVVGPEGVVTEAIVDEAFVQVTGTPYIFDVEFEEEFGDDEAFGFLFEDEIYDDYEDSIVIVADSLEVVR